MGKELRVFPKTQELHPDNPYAGSLVLFEPKKEGDVGSQGNGRRGQALRNWHCPLVKIDRLLAK